jgi:predicted Zn finger-like uncharacterized protein
MPVTIVCPNLKCKAMLQVADSLRGQQVRCKQCGQAILVPAKSTKGH